MDKTERLNQIKAANTDNNGVRPAGSVTRDVVGDAAAEVRGKGTVLENSQKNDVSFLLETIEHLEEINKQLVTQNQELVVELENVKADFGDRR